MMLNMQENTHGRYQVFHPCRSCMKAMRDDLKQTALATWAAKDIPARLLAGEVAKILNCSTEDVAIRVSARKLRALGKPRPNAVKFFSAIELIALLADPDWLDDATKAIIQFWKRKNARHNGVTLEKLAAGPNQTCHALTGRWRVVLIMDGNSKNWSRAKAAR